MRANVAFSYVLTLVIVGFCLWVLRAFVRWLKQRSEPPESTLPPLTGPESVADERIAVNWPVHLFLRRDDDLPIPGRIAHINPAGAFLLSSADLKTGQIVSLYIEVPKHDQVRASARILWARTDSDGQNCAQVRFEGLSADVRAHLFRVAGERPLLVVGEGDPE